MRGVSEFIRVQREKAGVISPSAGPDDKKRVAAYRYFDPLKLIIVPQVKVQELSWLYDRELEEQHFNTIVNTIRSNEMGETAGIHVLDADNYLVMSSRENVYQYELPKEYPEQKGHHTYAKNSDEGE